MLNENFEEMSDKEKLKEEKIKRNQKEKIYRDTHKELCRAISKKYKDSHKEQRSAYNKMYKEKNREIIKAKKQHTRANSRFADLRYEAKRRKLEFNLTFENYQKYISEPCYYCNFELGEPVTSGAGLDRVDSSKGYIEGNVVSCCRMCNLIKSDFLSQEETKIAVKAIIDVRESNKINNSIPQGEACKENLHQN